MQKSQVCNLRFENPYASIIRIRFRVKTPGYHLSLPYGKHPISFKVISPEPNYFLKGLVLKDFPKTTWTLTIYELLLVIFHFTYQR